MVKVNKGKPTKSGILKRWKQTGSLKKVALSYHIRYDNLLKIARKLEIDTSETPVRKIIPRVIIRKGVRIVRKPKAKPKRKMRIPYKDRFHPLKPFPHNVAKLTLERKESVLDLDEWVSRDTWDEVCFGLEEKLTKRIEGVIKRQAKRGYYKFGLIIHADKERISGDEEINIDKYVTTSMNRIHPDLVTVAFKSLHLKIREILRNYEWHIDKLIVLGDMLKQ